MVARNANTRALANLGRKERVLGQVRVNGSEVGVQVEPETHALSDGIIDAWIHGVCGDDEVGIDKLHLHELLRASDLYPAT